MTGVVEELVAALQTLVNRYGYEDDNVTPKDWSEYVAARSAISRFNAERGRQPDDEAVERADRVLRERAYALNRPRVWRLEVVRAALIAAITPEGNDE